MATERDLQLAFHIMTFGRYEIILPNIYFLHNEMDLFGFRKGSGFSDEIEIKLTKSDYLADFKKTTYHKSERKLKHDAIKEGLSPCNYFAYLMPKELADQCDIPSYAGLYVYRTNNEGVGYIQEIRKAPRLHTRKLTDEKKFEIAKKAVYRCWDMMKSKVMDEKD